MSKPVCFECGKIATYISDHHAYCEDCGSMELHYSQVVDAYIRVEHNADGIHDDDISDIEVFEKIEN